jgi:hypothetical protein
MIKYIIVGGNPMTGYTGTTTFTGLDVIGTAHTKEEAESIFNAKHDQCAGLLMIVDAETGKAADMGYHKQ